MFQHRLANGLSSGRKPQTAVKQTVDRPKPKSWSNDSSITQRNHSYLSQSTGLSNQFMNEDNSWLKFSTKPSDNTLELDLTCEEDTLSECQLQNYPTQVNISHYYCMKLYMEYLGI